MLLALYSGCVILLIGIVVYMHIYLIVNRRSQVMLCTECRSCVSACPLLAKGCNPMDVMLAAKSGREEEIRIEGRAQCVGCGRCEKACPRGLAPYLETSKWKAKTEAGRNHS